MLQKVNEVVLNFQKVADQQIAEVCDYRYNIYNHLFPYYHYSLNILIYSYNIKNIRRQKEQYKKT